jgi:hypothetical protein
LGKRKAGTEELADDGLINLWERKSKMKRLDKARSSLQRESNDHCAQNIQTPSNQDQVRGGFLMLREEVQEKIEYASFLH